MHEKVTTVVGTPLEDWPNRPNRAGPAAPSKALASPEGRRKLRLQVSAWRRVSCWACRQTIDQALLLHDDHGVAVVAEELYVLSASAICVAHFCIADDASLGNRPTERSTYGAFLTHSSNCGSEDVNLYESVSLAGH